jgi:hypothetical protein
LYLFVLEKVKFLLKYFAIKGGERVTLPAGSCRARGRTSNRLPAEGMSGSLQYTNIFGYFKNLKKASRGLVFLLPTPALFFVFCCLRWLSLNSCHLFGIQ